MSNAEIAAMMRSMTPAQRQALIEQFLAQQGLLSQNGDKNWPTLPDGFFNQDTYTYKDDNGKEYQLSTLNAAATVAMLSDAFAHFKVDILALSDTAGKLKPQADLIRTAAIPLRQAFDKVDKMWAGIFDLVGNSEDPNVAKARDNYNQLRNSLLGGTVDNPAARSCQITDGNISIVAKAVENEGVLLYEMASAYVEEEERNLSWFGLHADDPRPAWEKARFHTSADLKTYTDLAQDPKYPPGYFDPTNPHSPYYQPPH